MPLTLEKETMEMNWKESAGMQTTQILLEGDMIVPDSKPDLSEILCCGGKVKWKEKRISEERLSFSGTLEVWVLYRAKQGEKPVYAMKSNLPVEDFLHMEGLEKGMEVSLTGEVEHLDCRIINDRKVSVKAVIAVKAEAQQEKKEEILTDVRGDGIEVLRGTLWTEGGTEACRERFSVKEELEIPASAPEVGEILKEEMRLTDEEFRPMDGKAAVRGNLLISLLYMDEMGNLGSLTEKIPFSGYLEKDTLHPKMNLNGNLTIEDCRLTPMVDEDGETRRLAAEAAIAAELEGREPVEHTVLLDAYGPKEGVSLQKETITYPLTIAEGKNQFTIKEKFLLESEEMPMLRAEMLWGNVQLSEAKVLPLGVEAEGVINAELLYHCADDAEPIGVLRRGIPFAQTMELKDVEEGDTAMVTLRLEDMDFQMLSEKEGELRATVTMETEVIRQQKAEVVTDVMAEEEQETLPAAGAVIYVVQPGDDLWKIAKKYRTTIADITAVNELENPELLYPGQKLLIVRGSH